MQINTWYTFEDDEHSYGYTLFCPIIITGNKAYGLYISCNDSGPYYGSKQRSWTKTGFAFYKFDNNDSSIEYYDRYGDTPPYPREIIDEIFKKEDTGFMYYFKNETIWIN